LHKDAALEFLCGVQISAGSESLSGNAGNWRWMCRFTNERNPLLPVPKEVRWHSPLKMRKIEKFPFLLTLQQRYVNFKISRYQLKSNFRGHKRWKH